MVDRGLEARPSAPRRADVALVGPATEVAGVDGPAPTLAAHHADFGNQQILSALRGEGGALGSVLAAGVALDAAGVATESPLGSNTAMLRLMRARTAPAQAPPDLGRLGGGRPLPPEHLARFEAVLDHDLGHVRVHVGGGAAAQAEALRAHAFALGADLFFGEGEYAPGTPEGDRLLLHELTHVVQHDEGRIPSGGGVSDPSDPLEQEAYAAEDRLAPRLADVDPQGAVAEAHGQVPQAIADRIAMRDAPAEAPPEEADAGLLADFVRAFSPRVADIIDHGFAKAFEAEIEAGIQGWIDSLLADVDWNAMVESFLSELGAVADVLAGAAMGDPTCCEALTAWLTALQGIADRWIATSPAAAFVAQASASWTQAMGPVAEFLVGAAETVLAAVGPILEEGGSLVADAIDWAMTLNEDWGRELAAFFGVEEAEGGLLGLLVREVSAAVAGLSAGLSDAVDMALNFWFALPGAEAEYRLVDTMLELIDGIAWLVEHWGEDNLVERSHEEMGGTWVPRFVEAVDLVNTKWDEAVAWVGATATAALDLGAALGDSLVGVPVFSGVLTIVREADDAIRWVAESPMWGEIGGALQIAASYGWEVLTAFAELLLALPAAVNPLAWPGILAMGVLAVLPECLVAAVFDVMITFGVAFLDMGLVPLITAMFGETLAGVVVPVARAQLLGFLEAARSLTNDEKKAFFEGFALLFSGVGGIEFTAGLVFGLVEGVILELWGLLQLVMWLNDIAMNLVMWLVTLWPRLAMWLAETAVAVTAGVVAGIARGIDAAGDRHFQEDAFAPATNVPASGGRQPDGSVWSDPNPPVPGSQEASSGAAGTGALDGEAASAGASAANLAAEAAAFDQAGQGAGTASSTVADLQAFLGSLFDAVLDGVKAITGAFWKQMLEAFVWMIESPFTVGRWIGWAVGVLAFEVLLTKGAAALAGVAPKLAKALQFVVDIVKAIDDVQDAVFMGALRKVGEAFVAFGGAAAGFLRKLPFGNKLVDVIEAVIAKVRKVVDDLLAWIEKKLGRKADDADGADGAGPSPAEKAAVAAQAAVIVKGMDATGASLPEIFVALKTTLEPVYPWIRAWRADPKRILEWDLYMIASQIPVAKNVDTLPDGLKKGNISRADVAAALEYIRAAGDKLTEDEVARIMKLAEDLGAWTKKADPGSAIDEAIAQNLTVFLESLDQRIIANNPILTEAWERALYKLRDKEAFEDWFDPVTNQLKREVLDDKEKMTRLYTAARGDFADAFDGVLAQLVTEWGEILPELASFPKGVHLHHLLYKSKFPPEALNAKNLMLALGGSNEMHSLVHLLSKGGVDAPGSRWSTQLEQLAVLLREVYGID